MCIPDDTPTHLYDAFIRFGEINLHISASQDCVLYSYLYLFCLVIQLEMVLFLETCAGVGLTVQMLILWLVVTAQLHWSGWRICRFSLFNETYLNISMELSSHYMFSNI